MRVLLSVLALVGLCACKPKPAADAAAPAFSEAWSERPLYRSQTGVHAPMRSGLWVHSDVACPFQETESAGAWPGCAEFMVVRPRLLITHDRIQGLVAQSYLLIEGYPEILQTTQGFRSAPRLFIYQGFRPLSSDAQGKVVRARLWSVFCGPVPGSDSAPPSAAPASGEAAEGPVGGPMDDDCQMRSQGQIRSEVIATEDRKDETGVFHWVRDEEH